jgi:ribonuclease HI
MPPERLKKLTAPLLFLHKHQHQPPTSNRSNGQVQDRARPHASTVSKAPCSRTPCHLPPRHNSRAEAEAKATEAASTPAFAPHRQPDSRRAGRRTQAVTQGNQAQTVWQDCPSAGMPDSHDTPPSLGHQANSQVKREYNDLQQEYYADPTGDQQQEYYADPTGDQVDHVHIPRALRFWPSEFLATPRELFAHDSSDMDLRQGRPARMTRYDAPSDEILLYTAASCLSWHDAHGDRRAASSCIFKPTGLHPSESRSVAVRVERRGPTGQINHQESNRAHIRAAILALQCREWHEEWWSSVVIASSSEYLVEGITKWVEIWQGNGWRTSKDTGDNREGDAVANQDLWETLLHEISELSSRGLDVKSWLIIHGLNKEAQKEATHAAKTLKDEESFSRYPFV